jgi:glycerol-3-phosphate acyltransferase PlsX
VEALTNSKMGKINIVLVGKEGIIKEELQKYPAAKDAIEVVNASEIIETHETPTIAIKAKKDSSMVVGLNLLKEGRANAFISAGSTGALLTGSVLKIKRIKGIERPALGAMLPVEGGFSLLIDCGANVDCKPSYLLQFGLMGSVYMENIQGIKSPKVALANIGAEKEKGNALTKEASELLTQATTINFTNNIEARDIPKRIADVVVCDGFVGNIILKTAEGYGKFLLDTIKTELTSTTTRAKIGALLAKGAFKNVKKQFDHSEVGGAPLLGLQSLVVKAHGSAKAKDIVGAVRQAYNFSQGNIVEKIQAKL